jgi:hypothetical protein
MRWSLRGQQQGRLQEPITNNTSSISNSGNCSGEGFLVMPA